MAGKKHWSYNPKDTAATEALLARHPEYNDDNYVEDDEPISLSDAAAMWEATGRDAGYKFGYTQEELEGELEL